MKKIKIPLKLINLQDDDFHLLVEIVVFGEKHFSPKTSEVDYGKIGGPNHTLSSPGKQSL